MRVRSNKRIMALKKILWVAIIPSARNRLTFKAIEANNRQRCRASCCALFDSSASC